MNYGADQALTITPNTGYHILDVGADGASSVGAVSVHTFNVTANHTITAAFAQAQPLRQHCVLVHALRQRRRPYPLSLTRTRHCKRNYLLRLLQSIQERAKAVAGVLTTR